MDSRCWVRCCRTPYSCAAEWIPKDTTSRKQMAETILITTTDLEPAVRLRDAFEDAGFTVELMTSGEHVGDVPDPALLILTGPLADRLATRLVREAHEHDRLPVLGLAASPDEATAETCRRLGIAEAVA